MTYIRLLLIFAFITIYPMLAIAQEEDSAIIIMYHRFGEGEFPTTNITLNQFDTHIEELIKNQYNVVPLRTIIEAIKNNRKLPIRTIAITIDDGYLSIYKEAWPRLKKANLPFTLFISTESVNNENTTSMSWDQIRELENDPLVEIGHHGHSHAHMTELSIEDAIADIAIADGIYQKELGYIPDLFAFPYGEFSEDLVNAIKTKNYKAGFAQYSSPVSSNYDIMSLPRFAFNESYSDIDRFKLIINSRALPVKDVLPRSPTLTNNPPSVGFTVSEEISGINNLACFPSHMSDPAHVQMLGETRIEIRFDDPFPTGRQRINCTMPGPDNRWYWFGMPFFNLN